MEPNFRLARLVSLLELILVSGFALGQTVDLAKDRVPMTELTGPWRFHAGDNPEWSNPDFDDRGGSLLRTETGWSEKGYKGYGGIGWYRIRILRMTAEDKSLVFYLPNVDESCEIYAHGKLIGGVGRLPPNSQVVQESRTSFPIPSLWLLAVDLLFLPFVCGTGLHSPFFPVVACTRLRVLERLRQFRSQPANEIARVAQLFGQEDDITVLTLGLHGYPRRRLI